MPYMSTENLELTASGYTEAVQSSVPLKVPLMGWAAVPQTGQRKSQYSVYTA